MGNNVGRAEHAKYESTVQFTQALVARFGSHTNNSVASKTGGRRTQHEIIRYLYFDILIPDGPGPGLSLSKPKLH